jgi:hypothetical protein
MKPTTLSLLLTALPLLTLAQAPTPAPGSSPPPATEAAPKLTEAQVSTVLKQLADLEKDIQQRRGTNLSGILAKLRAAMASDQEAESLFIECDKVVNSERKDEKKAEGRKREEETKNALERKGSKGGNGAAAREDGDFYLAVRLYIHYLVLTLEAHEAKEEEFKKMVPKLQAYIAQVLEAAPKLKGRAYGYLMSGGSGGAGRGGNANVIVEAFLLDRYLQVQKWTNRPLDFGGMYSKTILPLAEEDNKDLLPGLYDARINAEGTFRKEQMFEAEYALWIKNELPALRWQRANYLYEKGPSALTAMGDMLKLIKDHPDHPDAPSWVKELRSRVNDSSPTKVSANLEPTGS